MLQILHGPTEDAVNLAAGQTVGTRAAAVVTALYEAFEELPASAEIYDGSDNLLASVTLEPFTAETSGDVKRLRVGASGATTFHNIGTPALVLFRHSDGTAIFQCSAGVGSGDISFQFDVYPTQDQSLGTTSFYANVSLDDLGIVWATVPTVTFTEGTASTYDLAQYVTADQSYTLAQSAGTLPTGVTFNAATNELEYDGAGAVGSSIGNIFTATPASQTITFAVVSDVGGTVPFCFGHAFREGDIQGDPVCSEAGVQVTVKNRWPDGSVKFGIVAGTVITTAGVAKSMNLLAGTPSAASAIPLSALQAVITSGKVTLALAPYGTVDLADIIGLASSKEHGSPGLVRTWQSGPQCSEWHFYSPVGTDPHLAVWFHVRMFSNGSIEVETIVENGWCWIASPGLKSYTATLTINGSIRYTGTPEFGHRHHSRWSREDWFGTDPQVVPQHDGAYFRSTRMIPNYGGAAPDESLWSESVSSQPLIQTVNPEPFSLGNYREFMGGEGFTHTIAWCPIWEALYATSQDARAYRAMVGNARLAGRFMIHYRDETDQMRPVRATRPEYRLRGFSQTLLGIQYTEPPALNADKFPTPVDGGAVYTGSTWVSSHSPGVGYLAYLATGRYSFMESVQFASSIQLLSDVQGNRPAEGSNYLNDTVKTSQQRVQAWALRDLTQAFTALPDADSAARSTLRDSLDRTWQWFVDNRVNAPAWSNALNITFLGNDDSSDEYVVCRNFMENYAVTSFSMAYMLGAASAEKLPVLQTLAEYMLKLPVGLVGDGITSGNWRMAGLYNIYVGPGTGKPPSGGWFSSHKAANDAQAAALGQDTWAAYADLTEGLDLYMSTTYELTNNSAWQTIMANLATAVDCEVTGAVDSWRRISTSATFNNTLNQAAFRNYPQWAWVPR